MGKGYPLAPLLFAQAIEPPSHIPKLTMRGMHIDVKQDIRHAVVVICANDNTIFAGGLDIVRANEIT